MTVNHNDEKYLEFLLLINDKDNVISSQETFIDMLEISPEEFTHYVEYARSRGLIKRMVLDISSTGSNPDNRKYLFGVFD